MLKLKDIRPSYFTRKRNGNGKGRKKSNGNGKKPSFSQRGFFEAMEPRLLLNADLSAAAALALEDGLGQIGDRIEDFLQNEGKFDVQIPFIVQAVKIGEEFENVAPTIRTLFSTPVDSNNDGTVDAIGSEHDLWQIDNAGNGDGTVDAGELLQKWFFRKAADFSGSSTDSFVSYLESLDQTLNLPDGKSITFEFVNVADQTPVADTSTPAGEVSFDVDFELTVHENLAIDLGTEADALKIVPFVEEGDKMVSPKIPVDTILDFGFTFGVNTGGQELPGETFDEGDFFVRTADSLNLSVRSDKTGFDPLLNVGFLGAEIYSGDIYLRADVETSLIDPDDPDILGFADAEHGIRQVTGVVTADNSIPAPNLEHEAGFFLRVGNLGIATPVIVADNNRADLSGLLNDVTDALEAAGLEDIISASLTGSGGDTLQFSLVSTTDSPFGFANESIGLDGVLTATPGAFEYASDVTFLLSVDGGIPKLVTVNFPDTAKTEIGFGDFQYAELPDLVGQNNAVANGQLSGDATFNISVTQSNGYVLNRTITIAKTSTVSDPPAAGDNISRSDLANDIDAALAAQGLGSLIDAKVSGTKIALDGAASVSCIRITSVNSVTQNDIGFVAGQQVTLSLRAANAVTAVDLSHDAHIDIAISTGTYGSITTTSKTITVPSDDNSTVGDLAADINAAMDAALGDKIDVTVDGSDRIVLTAKDNSVVSFNIKTINNTIDDLVDDVNRALADAGLASQVTASAGGTTQLILTSSGGESLEITRTLTFDAGFTYAELQTTDTEALFLCDYGDLSNISFDLPVRVLAGLEDGSTSADDDWNPHNVAIVGNFNPFSSTVASYDDVEARFDLALVVEPADQEDSPATDLTVGLDEIKLFNFAELLNFNVVAPESMIGLLGQLGSALADIAQSGLFSLYDVPFSTAALSTLLAFSQLIQTKLVYDVGPNGEEDENPDAPTDDISKLLLRTVVNIKGAKSVKLLPAFGTAQELASTLEDILTVPAEGIGGINATYNPETNELTYDVDLISPANVSVGVPDTIPSPPDLVPDPFEKPFEFDLDLSPFREFTVDSVDEALNPVDAKVRLQAYTGLGMTFGVDLSPGGEIKDATPLNDLNNKAGVDVKPERAVTGEQVVRSVFGLHSDASFNIKVGSDAPVLITILKSDTDATDGSINSFVDVVQNSLDDKLVDGIVTVTVTPENKLQFTAADIIDLIPVTDDPSALTELGFDPKTLETPAATVAAKNRAPIVVGLSGDAEFKITITDTSLPYLIPKENVEVKVKIPSIDTINNYSIADLVADVNNALRNNCTVDDHPNEGLWVIKEDGEYEGIRAEFDAGRLVLTATDETTEFNVTVDDATPAGVKAHQELGFALSNDANHYDFVIVDRLGTEYPISLDGLATIGEVIDAIDDATGDVVTAGYNATGTGLRLTDHSTHVPDAPALRVETINGSTAVLQLGFLTNPDESDPSLDPDIIEGGPIGTRDLQDRFFVRDGQMRGEAIQMDIVQAGGIGGDALYGIVGVDVKVTGGLLAELTADLKAPGEAAGSKVTLSQLNAGDDVVTNPLVSKGQELRYTDQTEDFLSGRVLTGADSGATAIILTHESDGPFSESGTLTLYHVRGEFLDGEVITDDAGGSATADGTLSPKPSFGEFNLSTKIKPGFGSLGFGDGFDGLEAMETTPVDVPVSLTGFGDPNASTPVEPVASIDLSNIGDLAHFDKLGYEDLKASLEGLEGLLSDIDGNFAFLNEKLPLINKSINDLLNLVNGFSHSVDNASGLLDEASAALEPGVIETPELTLQGLAQALREAFGLPSDSNGVVIDFNGADDLLNIGLTLNESVTSAIGLDVALGGGLPNLTSGKILKVIGSLDLQLDVGIDLADPQNIYLYDSSNIAGNLVVEGHGADGFGMVFKAMVGDLAVDVMDGRVDISAGFSLSGLDFSATGGRKLLSEVGFSDFTPITTSDVDVVVPLFDPQGGLGGIIGEITASGSLDPLDLLNPLTINVPTTEINDIIGDLIAGTGGFQFDPLDNLQLAADDLDFFLEGLQDILDGEVFGIKLPFIGDKLAEATRFIEDFKNTIVSSLRAQVEKTVNLTEDTVTNVLYNVFHDKLDLLQELNPAGDADDVAEKAEDILVIPVDTNADVEDQFAQWNFRLGDSKTVPFDLGFDIGIPVLGMDVDIPLQITIGWSLDLGFGVSFEEGAYIDVSKVNELSLTLDLTLPNDADLFTGSLAFLQLTVTNNGSGLHLEFNADLKNSNPSPTTPGRLGFSDLGFLDVDASLMGGGPNGDPPVNLNLAVGLPGNVSTVFPQITANFILDWSLDSTPIGDLSGDALKAGLKKIELNDIQLDAGSFLSDFLGPFLDEIKTFTEPFQPLIDVLTYEIPIISDLAGTPVTLLDLASFFGNVDSEYIDWITDVLNVIDVINGIPTDSHLLIPIGSLSIYESNPGGAVSLDNLFNPDFKLDALDLASLQSAGHLTVNDFDTGLSDAEDGSVKETVQKLREGEFKDILSFPILDNPLQVIGVFLGQPVTLIQADIPPLGVDFSWHQSFPVFGPLAVAIEVGFGVTIDLSVGFDTYGFQRYAEGGFVNPTLIADGFFLGDRENVTQGADIPELSLELSLAAAAELNLGIARAGVAGGVTARIFFDWFDPIPDGAVHLSELLSTIENQIRFSDHPELAPLSIFDLGGDLIFKLYAFLVIDFGIFEFSKDFPITPDITLLSFTYSFERPPILATDAGNGTLVLNMGPNAVDRLNGDTSDGSEEFFVELNDAGEILVKSPRLGVSSWQNYGGGFKQIVGIGGQGDDTIQLSGFDNNSLITAKLDGGVGNDTIRFVEDSSITPATGAGSFITGGPGNDTLIGSHLNDVILGGEGDDWIEGGRGYDLLFGDDGDFGVGAEGSFIGKRVSIMDGKDTIYGGSSSDAGLAAQDADDILIGGGGDDTMYGDAGSDVIIGDGGRFVYTLDGDHVNVNSLKPAPFVPNDKTDPNPATPTTEKIDDIFVKITEKFSGTDLGFGGNDIIFGGSDSLQNTDSGDIIFGGSGDDVIGGDPGNDYIVGGKGFDTISGGEGDDTLFGNDQDDRIDGNAGDDVISGGFGDDVLHGNENNDYMVGGRGRDVMYGDAGDDEVLGEGEPDILFGGIGNDLVIGGVGADIMFGDDGIVAKLDPDKTAPYDDVVVGVGDPAILDEYRDAADINKDSMDIIITDAVSGDGNDYLSGDAGADIILGGGGDDLIGGDVDPRFASAGTPSETGDDILIGDGGVVQFFKRRLQRIASLVDNDPATFQDTIYGDNGDDVIIGGQGADSGSFMLGSMSITRMLAGGHGPGRGTTDTDASDNDIIIGDNGELIYADESIAGNFGKLELIQTTDGANETGGADTAYGELGDDIIFGGVNGSTDVLNGNAGDDVILGDDGLLDFDFNDAAHDLTTVDLVQSFIDGFGGTDIISGNAGEDTVMGGTGGDQIYGDDSTASAGSDDGQDILLGDNGIILTGGHVDGRLNVLGSAVKFIHTSDEQNDTGGADTIEGNAAGDVIIGGVNGSTVADRDELYGDAQSPGSLDGDDVILGDNGLIHFDYNDSSHDLTTLDIIATRPYKVSEASILDETFVVDDTTILGGDDLISGNTGHDTVFGGVGSDEIYGDAETPGGSDLADMLLGDNGEILMDGHVPGKLFILDSAVRLIQTTDVEEGTGGADYVEGRTGDDVILGGVNNGGEDELYGNEDNDVILGDNGLLNFGLESPTPELTSLDLVESKPYGPTPATILGGRDIISGNVGDDTVIGGTAGDDIYGDDENATGTSGDGDDILLGDHGKIVLAGAVAGERTILDSAVELIETTDTEEATGGADLIEGNAGADVIIGGVNDGGVDRLYGDAAVPSIYDGDDILLGDNGLLDYAFNDDSRTTLDLIQTEDFALGGTDHIFGNAFDDIAIGGRAGDIMIGDNYESMEGSGVANQLETQTGEDILLGDQGQIIYREGLVTLIETTDLLETDGGADYIEGNDHADIIMGGVAGDILIGEAQTVSLVGTDKYGDDVILGDEGRMRYDVAADEDLFEFDVDGIDPAKGDGDPLTLDLIETFKTGDTSDDPSGTLGGKDTIFGNDGSDIAMGGTDADQIYGDFYATLTISGGEIKSLALAISPNPGTDILIGDGGQVTYRDSAMTLVRTIEPSYGGADMIQGNDLADKIMGGFDGDLIYGEAPADDLDLINPGYAGADYILGDNGRFDYILPEDTIEGRADVATYLDGITVTLDTDPSNLDRVKTTNPIYGGDDIIYGNGNSDTIFGGTGSDTIRGDTSDDGAGPDGADGIDIVFGDHGKIYPTLPAVDDFFQNNNFFSIDTQVEDGADTDGIPGNDFEDVIYGNANDDILIGGQDDDIMFGGTGDDDMIGGHNVSGGDDDIDSMPLTDQLAINPDVLANLNPADVNKINDIMDGGEDDDVMAGDNAYIIRQPYGGQPDPLASPRFRMVGADGLAYHLVSDNLEGLADVDVGFYANVTGDFQPHQDMTLVRTVQLLDHDEATENAAVDNPDDPRPFGNDIMAGGIDDDEMWGELGDDIMQGDGAISQIISAKDAADFDPYNPAQNADPSFDLENFVIRYDLYAGNDTEATLRFDVFETLTDGDDYMEGNGGNDRMYGNLGQDDIIGGSSTLFGLNDNAARPDGADLIYGGAGNPALLSRNASFGGPDNDVSDDTLVPEEERHAFDADVILGDNGDIFRLVKQGDSGVVYESFNYDYDATTSDGFVDDGYNSDDLQIRPRAVNLVDYGYEYADADSDPATRDVLTFLGTARGEGDLIYGESGDDIIHGMTGNDTIFGNSEHDDLYGEIGTDVLLGGTGVDGIVGDDGLILTRRNDTTGEPLYGIAPLDPVQVKLKPNEEVNTNAIDAEITTPGNIQREIINVGNELTKSVELFSFRTDDLNGQTMGEFEDSLRFNDIIFGGLDNDFIHGGDGDDAVSGGEALPAYYSAAGFAFSDINTFLQNMQSAPPHGTPDLADNPFWFDFAPYNPGEILRYEGKAIVDGNGQNAKTRDEFAWYDEFNPRRKIVFDFDFDFDSGELFQGIDRIEDFSGTTIDFILNFDETEGADDTRFFDAVQPTDGDDRIFGDLGNDWIVGGSGRDHMYGGRGDDLLNMDDNHDSGSGGRYGPHDEEPGSLDNTQSDEYQAYADIAYGGAGRDVLILNTGADRAIDWVGEFNSYIVPFSPFGAFQISRTLQPQLPEFLQALSVSDGVDARVDASKLNNVPDAQLYVDQKSLDVRVDNPDPLRNYEPYGELGMVRQTDYDWHDQTGAPNDPQPGNWGGKREIMRRELFNDATAPKPFAADVGAWKLVNGKYAAAPAIAGGEAVSIYYLDMTQPSYMEILVTVNADKDKAGVKSDAYIIFDYQSDTDFKFAGIDVGLDKLRIGHRTADGWVIDAQSNLILKDNTDYKLLVALHGTMATLVVDGKTSLGFDFKNPLNDGYIGLGTDNSVARFDDWQVQKLPPVYTFTFVQDFSGTSPNPFEERVGDWTITDGRYTGSSGDTGEAAAIWSFDVAPSSRLEFEALVTTGSMGGLIFDYYNHEDFKFATISVETGEVVIGHRTSKGMVIDASVSKSLSGTKTYKLGISMLGGSVSVTLNGTVVLGYVYNSLLNDGSLGLLSSDGSTAFDDVVARGDDPAFSAPQKETASSAPKVAVRGGSTLTSDELQPIVIEAISRLTKALNLDESTVAYLEQVSFQVNDLQDLTLGQTTGNTVTIDDDAAGYGWFIDPTPSKDNEFKITGKSKMSARTSGPAVGDMDLLTVVTHELGHVLGLDHSLYNGVKQPVMHETLDAGKRLVPAYVGANTNGGKLKEVFVYDDADRTLSLPSIPNVWNTRTGIFKINPADWETGVRGNNGGDWIIDV
jgi:Ca2+-binding RTX toxin-like protein